jgi:hypothetical protein
MMNTTNIQNLNTNYFVFLATENDNMKCFVVNSAHFNTIIYRILWVLYSIECKVVHI